MLYERRTEVISPEMESGTGSDFIFHELRAVLQEILERSKALCGTIEAFGISISIPSEPAVCPPELVSASGTLRASPVFSRDGTLGADLYAPVGPPFFSHNPISLIYRGRQNGSLHLHFAASEERLRRRQEREELGRELGFRLARIEIRQWARHKLEMDIPFVGTSAPVALLEQQIAKVGAVHYPVVLEAEFGSHEVDFAAAIHCSGPRRDEPFIVFHCSYPNRQELDLRLNDALMCASTGSLFVSGVDLLDDAGQRQFLCCLRFGRQARSMARIIASTSSPLSLLESDGKFCRMLRTELDVLHIRIPTLRERRADIRVLLEYFLRKHDSGEERRLSPAAWQACLNYDWPGNEVELERFAIRIAVMTETAVIDLDELRGVASWLPLDESGAGIVLEVAANEGEEWSLSFGDDLYEENEEPTPSKRHWLELLARKLVAREFDAVESFGIGMQRALRYIGEHFQEEISLGQLARQSFISVSHLSFLFKRDLGVPFKTLLAAVRIEKAGQLLIDNPQQSITEISLDAGFGDLSHFERTFKRLIGTNPRDYRRRQFSASEKVL
ncbi:MAG: sigma-54 interaction domain protein [Edaphobacter sp.]|nr:sigma-54 interaction domain protein [Edaphobacter sp.]